MIVNREREREDINFSSSDSINYDSPNTTHDYNSVLLIFLYGIADLDSLSENVNSSSGIKKRLIWYNTDHWFK